MKIREQFNEFLKHVAAFVCMYILLHLIYFYGGGDHYMTLMFSASIVSGIGAAIVSQRIRKKQESFWICVSQICILFVFFLAISALLFHESPSQGWLGKIFYYFPQLLILLYMIPGEICYVLSRTARSRRKR